MSAERRELFDRLDANLKACIELADPLFEAEREHRKKAYAYARYHDDWVNQRVGTGADLKLAYTLARRESSSREQEADDAELLVWELRWKQEMLSREFLVLIERLKSTL